MGKYWALMGEYDGETEAYTDLAGAHGATPYTPLVNGRIKGIRVLPNREAATTLINGIAIKLSNGLWSPNEIVVGCVGSGLQTAPALQAPHCDFEIDQPVAAGNPITMQGKNCTSDTPITVSVLIFGFFEGA